MDESSFKYRILIVEDDPGLREFGKILLSAQGYEVLCAEDGFEGLAALKRSLPDIIISDLRMPNMNGFEFLSVVRRRFPGIPVIAIFWRVLWFVRARERACRRIPFKGPIPAPTVV